MPVSESVLPELKISSPNLPKISKMVRAPTAGTMTVQETKASIVAFFQKLSNSGEKKIEVNTALAELHNQRPDLYGFYETLKPRGIFSLISLYDNKELSLELSVPPRIIVRSTKDTSSVDVSKGLVVAPNGKMDDLVSPDVPKAAETDSLQAIAKSDMPNATHAALTRNRKLRSKRSADVRVNSFISIQKTLSSLIERLWSKRHGLE